MNKLFATLATAILLVGCGSKVYTVEGEVKGAQGSVEVVDMLSEESLGATTTEDGTFSIEIQSDVAVMAALKINGQAVCPLFLDGDVVKVSGEMPKPMVSGTPSNDAFAASADEFKALHADLMSAEGSVSLEQLMAVGQQEKAINQRYYDENKSNFFGAFLLMSGSHKVADPQAIIDAIDACEKDVQKSKAVMLLRKNTQAQLDSSVGREYTNLTLPTPEGEEISLKSVVEEHKFVLLDFWASWCNPCMREMPHLIKAYGDYCEQGFEIYAVSLDEDKAKWMGAVNGDNLPWVNVSDLKGWKAESVGLYGVQSIPANFLIDAETGKIIAKNLRGEALTEKLAEIFNQ